MYDVKHTLNKLSAVFTDLLPLYFHSETFQTLLSNVAQIDKKSGMSGQGGSLNLLWTLLFI